MSDGVMAYISGGKKPYEMMKSKKPAGSISESIKKMRKAIGKKKSK